jgi:23S rRNA (cytosine1962-C5)-methyltransferase
MADILPYVLLDSGNGRKLERVGAYLVERQAATAFWKPRLPASEWKKAQAVHIRSDKGGGHWEFKTKLPESWLVKWGGFTLKVKPTAFGHFGFFAEVAREWDWFRAAVPRTAQVLGRPPKLLNLFGYTGGTSLAMGLAGAEVTHVDAAKGVVDWGRENAQLNHVPEGRIRWIVDDCIAYLKREERRGNKYDGFAMDPPSYGRGPNKEVFKLEDDVGKLLEAVRAATGPAPKLIHFSGHTPGFSPEVLHNLLRETFDLEGLTPEKGEMLIPETDVRLVPSGCYCRLAP